MIQLQERLAAAEQRAARLEALATAALAWGERLQEHRRLLLADPPPSLETLTAAGRAMFAAQEAVLAAKLAAQGDLSA